MYVVSTQVRISSHWTQSSVSPDWQEAQFEEERAQCPRRDPPPDHTGRGREASIGPRQAEPRVQYGREVYRLEALLGQPLVV